MNKQQLLAEIERITNEYTRKEAQLYREKARQLKYCYRKLRELGVE